MDEEKLNSPASSTQGKKEILKEPSADERPIKAIIYPAYDSDLEKEFDAIRSIN